MDVALLFPGKFIKSVEFKGKSYTFTITKVELEDLEGEGGVKRPKAVVSFKESEKKWLMNRTNSECLKGMFGKETDAWIGKRVTLFPEAHFNRLTKEQGTAIRVAGSPDIAADMNVVVRLAFKKDQHKKMHKTQAKNGALPPATPPPPPEPGGES